MRSVLLVLSLSACGAHAAAPRHARVEERPLPALFVGVPGHGDVLVHARNALREGEVADALDMLRPLLASGVAPEVPPELAVHVQGLLSETLDLEHVRGVEDGSRIVGAAAAWCGRCHRAAQVPVPPHDGFDGHPYRRLADMGWRSLVWPQGADWSVLAGTLAPFRTDAVPEDSEAPLAVLGRALLDVPVGEVEATGVAERIGVFAAVQASCGGCHRPKDEEEAPAEPDVMARR